MRMTTTCLIVLVAGLSLPAQAPTWPQFGGAGKSVSMENQRLPDSFGPEKNVIWSKEVIAGSSSPCIWGDRLFLTGHDDGKLAVLCFNRKTGAQLWRTDLKRPETEAFAHSASSPSAPTTCTDGERVIAYFGSYGLIALDMTGKELWTKTFPAAKSQFGHGSSPVIHAGSVYLVRDLDKAPSFVFCLDVKTGEERWVT